MKTKKSITRSAILAAIVMLFSLVATKSSAQTYTVFNNNSCDIVVDITFYDSSCNFCGHAAGVTVLANSSTGVPVPAGCSLSCEVDVTLSFLGSLPTTSNPPVLNSNNTSGTYNAMGPCSGGTVTWSLTSCTYN